MSSSPTTTKMQSSSEMQQQQQQQQQHYDEFRAGLAACLRSWSALRAAVEGGWGGNESLAKAEDLRNNILQHLDGSTFPPKTLTVDDLEDNLAIYLEEEYSVVLEDNSERQVADSIWRMYEQCAKGDATIARQLVEDATKVLQQSTAFPVKVQTDENDDDDDDEMMDTDDNNDGMDDDDDDAVAPALVPMVGGSADTVPVVTTMNAREYADQPLFGPPKPTKKRSSTVNEQPVRQLGETSAIEQQQTAIEVDEDGFAPVVKRKGRKV